MDPDKREPNVHTAAMEGQVSTLESLLNANSKLQHKRDQDGRVPLHWSVARNHVEVTKLLMERKNFEQDVEDSLGWTPLMMASNLTDGVESVKLLLQKGADPTLKNHYGQTALHFAASKGNLETARHLISNGASTRLRDQRSQLPIHRAAAAGWSPMVQLLLDHQSPVNTSDDAGLTALHHAIAEGRGDTAVLLLKAGADPNKEDHEGHLPINLAPDAKVRNFVLSIAEREGIEVLDQ